MRVAIEVSLAPPPPQATEEEEPEWLETECPPQDIQLAIEAPLAPQIRGSPTVAATTAAGRP